MRYGSVVFEKRNSVAVLTLDEPNKLNALSLGIRRGLDESFAAIAVDDEVRVAVVTGAGEKAFCAGADITGFQFEPAYITKFVNSVLDTLGNAERCTKPVIAAVNGLAFGGGLELAISCDFVLASERAKFGVPEIALGLAPAFGIVRLAEIVGRQRAKFMSLLGEPFSADQACAYGMVLEVVPHERLMERAMALADALAQKPQNAIRMMKSSYNRGLGGEEMNYAKDVMPFLFLTDDTREGVTAFLEKRRPQF